ELRQAGMTKHELKMRGIRESGDPNQYTRKPCAGKPHARFERERLAIASLLPMLVEVQGEAPETESYTEKFTLGALSGAWP
ncbi:MAG: hypothetical protein L0170_18955, partial [Acidobacteria bacterium]|nr:hypothetical protein [Acidobacteriota bacterium]